MGTKKVASLADRFSALEGLEARRLMAFTSAAYFPLTAGLSNTYASTVNGTSTTVSHILSSVTDSGAAVTRVNDTASIGQSFDVERDYVNGKHGLQLIQSLVEGTNFETQFSIPAGLPILPKTFTTGAVSSWKKTPVTADFVLTEIGNSGEVVGSSTGGTSVKNNGAVTMAGYTFVSTIKASTDSTSTFSEKISGDTYTAVVTISETAVLSPTVGVLSDSYTFSEHVTGGGKNVTHTDTMTNTLTGSSALVAFTRKVGTSLHIGGTSGDDSIGLGFDGDASKFLVVRNGVGSVVNTAGITSVLIDAGAGNDVVGPLKVGRLRSTILGGAGNDYLTGGSGRDSIDGGDGNDTLIGGPGNDTLTGDAGNDLLNGLSGADHLDGGLGTDTTRNDPNDTRIAIEVLV